MAEAAKERAVEKGLWVRMFGDPSEGPSEEEVAKEKARREEAMRWLEERGELGDAGKEEGVVKPLDEVVAPEKVMQAILHEKRGGEVAVEGSQQPAEVTVEAQTQPIEGMEAEGGPLDRTAKEAVEKGKGGWSSWFGGKR